MLLTITTTHAPATDLGYLLHKHPGKVQSFALPFGTAYVFYTDADDTRCTAALMLDVDPIDLVRGRKGPSGEGFALGQYVNDRPYASSSMLAVAMSRVLKSALAGRCDARPELADTALPLEINLPAVPCRGGADMAEALFGPLGWTVEATTQPLDEHFPQWGDSRYVTLRLTGTLRLGDALSHLYVLLPALDGTKHYWVSTDEVDKLIRRGEGWLPGHPLRELITRRYLSHHKALVRTAVARLAEVDDAVAEAIDNAVPDPEVEEVPDAPVPLVEHRHGAVLAALRSSGARRVLDLGCGDGALVASLLADPAFTEVVGVDVSFRALEYAARRLRLDRMPERRRERLDLFQSALTYRDDRLVGYDAAVLMEVIEHVELPRLGALEKCVFGHARPATVIVTTPNVEHNVRYEMLAHGTLRHRDHRFEWTRAEFRAWADRVGAAYGYEVRYLPVGADDPEVGPPTQMAVFARAGSGEQVAS
ncbi:MAG TPA: 3' terminal RNA ribose 2'-O-methyltransferase Hen1 [Frankiaceae bacterium]|nr:3' terminal RNA ribose 2'-O-methyltransferase Hen1 [Frankiaceae bacterium]